MNSSVPAKESGTFDIKIRSRHCTWHDYGKHLLRMLKRAITFDELKNSGKYVSFNRIDSVTVYEDDKEINMPIKEFDDYYYKHIYNGGVRYRINYTLLETEADVVSSFDNKDSIRIYISK